MRGCSVALSNLGVSVLLSLVRVRGLLYLSCKGLRVN